MSSPSPSGSPTLCEKCFEGVATMGVRRIEVDDSGRQQVERELAECRARLRSVEQDREALIQGKVRLVKYTGGDWWVANGRQDIVRRNHRFATADDALAAYFATLTETSDDK